MGLTVFSIWSPWRDPNDNCLVKALLTNDNCFLGIPKEDEFALQLLSDIGVDRPFSLQIVKWNAVVYRSYYYSEYRESSDWRGLWPIVWRVDIQTSTPILPILSHPLIAWTSMESVNFHLHPPPSYDEFIRCLVIVDFSEHWQREQAIELTKAMLKKEEHPYPEFTKTTILKGLAFQLQVDLGLQGPSFYADNSSLAYRLMNIYKENKGILNNEEISFKALTRED